jgi:ParB family chromosome partitioning protein
VQITEEGRASGIREVSVDRILPNEHQPRRTFDEAALSELADSIRENGLLQPPVVRKADDGTYRLIAGERRWRASRSAGLEKIPVIVREAAGPEILELALIENIQREDLNPVETAEAFQRLIKDFHLTQEELSRKVGKDRATVANYVRILGLVPEVKGWIADGLLSLGHGKALMALSDEPRRQIQVAREVITRGLNVRETEALVRRKPKQVSPVKKKDAQISHLEDRMTRHLGAKVRLLHKSNKKGGRIEIAYSSLDELDRLLEILAR